MSFLKQLQFSPKELSANVKRETPFHKAKVVGWSAFMTLTAGCYLSYFSDVTKRSAQLQNLALAGQLEFNEYEPYDAVKQFNYKVLHDIYDISSMKDLKDIQMNWVSQIDDDTKEARGPQKQDWYTQVERFTEYDKLPNASSTDLPTAQEKINVDAQKYKEWETMHSSSVIWFDTAGCSLSDNLRKQYGVIGDANQIAWVPTSPQFYAPANQFSTLKWWVGDEENQQPVGADGSTNYGTNITPVNTLYPGSDAKINLADDFFLMKRNLKHLESMADCDMDCQAKGSQVTVVAALNCASLTLIMVNGLLGIWGGWSSIGRVAQTYCTFFTCLFQMAILIACATMLFTPYALQCYSSLFPTTTRPDVGVSNAGSLWTMHDDYLMVVGLWGSQFIWLFIFLVIGLCGAYKSEEGDGVKLM